MGLDTLSSHNPIQPSSADFAFSWRERRATLERAKGPDQIYDLCIVGGGITGAAIARDASLRGLSVLLVDKDDFANGTSSRSSKLVHGGVRYLEQYEFKLVMESTRERARLWKLAPHLVTPLPFLFPTFTTSRVPLWKLGAGLWLYDILSRFRSPSLHKRFNKKKSLAAEPGLNPEGLVGSIMYWDGATDDGLLTLSNIVDAVQSGSDILSRVEMKSIDWNPKSQSSRQEGHVLHLRDLSAPQGAQDFEARARAVVSATGPWTDAVLLRSKIASPRLLKPTRGSHIVVPVSRLPSKHAVVIFHPKDGRVLFTIPWGQSTVVGTTDVFDAEAPENVHITLDEIDYLLDAANAYFPASKLARTDVQSAWSGLRPLLAPPDAESASQVSREHHISWHEPGLLVIAGGKLTTHREMGEEAVNTLFTKTLPWPEYLGKGYKKTSTRDRPLPKLPFPKFAGGNSLGESEAARLTLDDVAGICRTQMVLSLEDLFVRRTQIFYKEPHHGWLLLPKIKKTLCLELNWDDKEWMSQVAQYRAYLEKVILRTLSRSLPEDPGFAPGKSV